MRTIRFRAKAKEDGRWVKGYLSGPKTITLSSGESHHYKPAVEVLPETIGQFTGISDKNGREIYEGDIVRYRWTDDRYKRNPQYYTATVSWDAFWSRWGFQGRLGCVFRPDRIEVVGNMHDNQEISAQTASTGLTPLTRDEMARIYG